MLWWQLENCVEFKKKEGYVYSTIYRIIQRYKQFKTTKDLPRSGRPRKLNNKQMAQITHRLNNTSGISQRNLGARKRVKAPKYVKDQEKRARKNCGVLYRQISKDCFIVMDDEKYFGLSGVDIP